MLRTLFKDSAIYTFSGLISRVLSLCLIPVYMIFLTPNEYGTLDLLLIFANIINLTVALEVSQGLARYYSFEVCRYSKNEYLSTAIWFTIFCYSVFGFVFLYFADSISLFVFGFSGKTDIFKTAVIYIWVNGIFILVINQFKWAMQSQSYALISVLVSFITTFSSIIFLFNFSYGVFGILYGLIFGSFFGLVICWFKLYKNIIYKINIIKLKQMLCYSIPLVPSGIAVFVNAYIDRMMISHFISVEDLGVYGVGFRIASSVGICILGFSSAMTPLIYKHYSDKSTPSKIRDLFRIFIAFALISNFLVNIGARFFFNIAEFSKYSNAMHVVAYLVPAILVAQMYVFAPGIDIEKKTHIVLLIQILGAFVNVVLNYFTIPLFGIIGAALSTLFGSLVVFFFYMFFSQKFYYVNHNWTRIFAAIFCNLFLCVISFKCNIKSINSILCQVLIFIMCLCSVSLTRLFTYKDFLKVFSFFKSNFKFTYL